MATRKSLVLVTGLFQELNTSSDKLDFAGNTTNDLTENTNLYYTNARSRASISVTDSGGEGSLSYNNSTGVLTYAGPSDADIRGKISIASGEGLTYNSSTGVLGTSAIPNSQLANSSITIGGTPISLGVTQTTLAGITSVTATSLIGTTLYAGAVDSANGIAIGSSGIVFEGSTENNYETTVSATDATADRAIVLPNESGTILTTGSSIANSNLANSAVTLGSTSVSLGATASTIAGLTSLTATTLYAGTAEAANGVAIGSSGIVFEGATADSYETTVSATDATADRAILFPNAAGTIALLETLSVAGGSGLTYNSGTGQFGTSSIPNSQLANSTITIGSASIALGGSQSTFTGLTSITSSAVVTDDSGLRIRDNSDNTKQLAFECSGISSGATRTLTVADESGTIASESFATAIAVALG